ncbi:MAG: zeta toxin family protein [Candidatus Nomurabacteria bacterium]|jgi:hypothetical protein|nr:zeta toxin family protein [Candidatus Nomurabacteria bacterium]
MHEKDSNNNANVAITTGWEAARLPSTPEEEKAVEAKETVIAARQLEDEAEEAVKAAFPDNPDGVKPLAAEMLTDLSINDGGQAKEEVLAAIEESYEAKKLDNYAKMIDAGLDTKTGTDTLIQAGETGLGEEIATTIEQAEVREQLKTGLPTAEAYIVVDQTGLDDREKKSLSRNRKSYAKERQEYHNQVLEKVFWDAKETSEKLGGKPRIIAMRGACGSGKTTSLRMDYQDKGIVVGGEIPGAIKPDFFKLDIIRKAQGELGVAVTPAQAHTESTALAKFHTEQLANDKDMSMVIDKQLEGDDDIADIISIAEKAGKSVELIDMDVPFVLSAVRVLKRELGGDDPNVPFQSIADGFEGIRSNRSSKNPTKGIENRIKSDCVDSYSLRAFDFSTKSQLEVAKKGEDGKLIIDKKYQFLFSGDARAEAAKEVEYESDRPITEEYVEQFVAKYITEPEQQKYREVLNDYVGHGMTLKEAINSKAAGIDPKNEVALAQWLAKNKKI